jgi:cysteine desulfurase
MREDESRIARMRDRMQAFLCDQVKGLTVNGDIHHRLAGNLHISLNDVPASLVISHLGGKVAVARGSACASATEAPSHVLRALGFTDEQVRGSIRIGIGRFNTESEVDEAGSLIAEAVSRGRHALLA